MTTREERPGVGLVLCPYFGFGTPPLGLASIQAALRAAGHRTVAFDLDFMLLAEDPSTINALYSTYHIGHSADLDRVQFILRPELTLAVLFPDAYPDTEPLQKEREILARVDQHMTRWASEILQHNVSVLMASVYVSNLLPTLLLAKAIKQMRPDVSIVLGGPGVSAVEVQTFVLHLGMIDVCVTGEGEQVAPLLADRLIAGQEPALPGTAFLHEGDIVCTPPAPLLAMDDLVTPDFTGLPIPGHSIHHYRTNPNVSSRWFGVALPIATTRGCVMRCTFCSETNYWVRFRQRKPERVVDEIAELVQRWGITQFTFGDSLLNGNPRWLEAFADRVLDSELSVTFVFAYFRPTRLPRPLLKKLARAGFRLVSFGLETASQTLLDALAKETRVPEVEQVVLDCLDVGIHVNLSILCGIPGETSEQVMESVRFVQSIQHQALIHSGPDKERGLTVHAGSALRVEPDSRMYQDPARAGITLQPIPFTLPTSLTRLIPVVNPLLVHWRSELDDREILTRSELLKRTIDRPPQTIFATESLENWVHDDTVVSPVQPSQVLTDASGRHYLSTATQVFAEVDDLTRRAWPYLAEGVRFDVIRNRLEAELPDVDVDQQLRQLIGTLLTHRFLYFNDFHPNKRVIAQPLQADASPSKP